MKKNSFPLLVACVALGLAVSACGSGQNGGNAGPVTRQNGYGNGGQGGGPGGGFGGPGGSGKVAAVSGSTAQVQGPGGQVAVTWTAKTNFTQQVTAAAKDLKVGDCVAATPAGTSSSSSDTSTVAAASVRISTAVDGACTGGMRGPRSGQSSGEQRTPPSGAPSGGDVRRMMGAFGKVTAVTGTGFTVESARPGSDDTSSVTVTTSADTTWTTSAKATSKDVKVGRCVSSFGRSDSTGAITAASIAVSPPVKGQCAVMFGGGPGGGGPGGSGGQVQNS